MECMVANCYRGLFWVLAAISEREHFPHGEEATQELGTCLVGTYTCFEMVTFNRQPFWGRYPTGKRHGEDGGDPETLLDAIPEIGQCRFNLSYRMRRLVGI